MRIRIAVAILAGSSALAACNGWPKAIDYKEAEHKAEKFPTYAAAPAEQAATFTFEQRTWMVEPTLIDLRGAKLQAVGSGGGATLMAQTGDQAPYGVLYAAAGGTKYRRVVPIE
jgi:hypothetical protein